MLIGRYYGYLRIRLSLIKWRFAHQTIVVEACQYQLIKCCDILYYFEMSADWMFKCYHLLFKF